MENFIRNSGPAAGQAIATAVPMVLSAAVAEPVLLGAIVGAALISLGIVLTVGVMWVAREI